METKQAKKKKMKNKLILLILIFIGPFSNAQQALSLNDAILSALENNYMLKIVKQNQRISEIQNDWGAAGRYPYINLSAGDNNSLNLNENENYINNRFTAGASLNWTLFDGYSVQINKQRFEELENFSKQNTAIIIEGTVQSVVLAYFNVLLQQEKLAAFEEVMNLSEDRFNRVETEKELGSAVTYDLLQAQNAFLSDRSAFLLQEVALKNALRDLKYLMAEGENMSYDLTEKFEAIPVEYTLEELETQLFENNRSLKNQYINQRLLENAVASAKSSFAPSLNFSGGITGTKNRINFKERGVNIDNSANFYGNFTLSYNLFSGGNRKRALQIAKIDEEVGVIEIEEMKHDLANSLENLYEFYLVRKELLNVANENLAAAKLNLEISRDKFESGAINSFNFRDVQNIYLNASQRKSEAIYNFIDTHNALLRMIGAIVQQYE